MTKGTKYSQVQQISFCFTNQLLHSVASDTIDDTIFLPQDKNATFPPDLIPLLHTDVQELLTAACTRTTLKQRVTTIVDNMTFSWTPALGDSWGKEVPVQNTGRPSGDKPCA